MPDTDKDRSLLEKSKKFIEASKRGETEPISLLLWLRHDTWSIDEAIFLLLGLNPRGSSVELVDPFIQLGTTKIRLIRYAEFLDGRDLVFDFGGDKSELDDLSRNYRDISSVWLSGNHADRNPPQYYIRWAREKGFNIPWFDWAEKNGLLKSDESERIQADQKTLTTRERHTVARIIAALSQEAKLDISHPYKAAGVLENTTEKIGIRVGIDTIAEWLKLALVEIPKKPERP